MLTVRSGLAESLHEADVVVVDRYGRELYRSGDVDRILFYRSAIKPFQTQVATEAGVELPDEHLAIASASHGGYPAHLAIVRSILADGGLGESSLQCPATWPLSSGAKDLQIRRGATGPRPIFHNCSGKHALMLRACLTAGWTTEDYLDPNHPLQRRIVAMVGEVSGIDPEPVGVDGCGAPTLRGSVRGLARAFATLTTDLRFETVARAVSRFPALVADNVRGDGRVALWWGGPVKVGAEGLIGCARQGIGLASRARGGKQSVAVAAALAAARDVGLLSQAMENALSDVAAPPVLGGGLPVGELGVARMAATHTELL